jgi:uncharacterized membrane protein
VADLHPNVAGTHQDVATPGEGSGGRDDALAVFSLRYSRVGLIVAVLFFALSLFPSLLPRTPLLQGVVAGASAALGYGVGVLFAWLWRYLSLPRLRPGSAPLLGVRIVVIGSLGVLTFLAVWRQVGWQNDIRELFGMEPLSPAGWLTTAVVAPLTAAVLIVVARALRKLFRSVARGLNRVLPVRLARVLGAVIVVGLVSFLVNGVLIATLFDVANAAFSVRDTSTDDGIVRPVAAERSGSPDSVVPWDSLGRQGRNFVARGPTVEELEAFHGEEAMRPIRVYAGLKSASTIQGRADLILEELLRTGAFEREVLVVATTTGTGFLEPNAMTSLEYLHNGDTAVAGVQYSYLPSWISLLADQEITAETSRTVFRTVHDHWRSLPEDERPALYLFGLSLGSFGVEAVLSSVEIVNAPVDGAFLTGPPFVNGLWNRLTRDRDAGSPARLPIYAEGRTVRFTAQENALDEPTGRWGDTRIVYLQYNSDPVVFFSPSMVFTRPEWLEEGQRGPDVSERMVFVPLVTAVQTLIDLPGAGNVPEGFGHLYSIRENIDSWAAVTRPEGWTEAEADRLEGHLLGGREG